MKPSWMLVAPGGAMLLIRPCGARVSFVRGRSGLVVQPKFGPFGIPNGPNFGCTTRPLLPLTNDTRAPQGLINNMAPPGATNIHEGFMWGWRTLSPKSVFAGTSTPAAYAPASNASNSTTINKIIILMT